MKKILLLSDTHSYMDEEILQFAEKADEVWHAGDIGQEIVMKQLQKVAPVFAVFGNIDDTATRLQWPEKLVLEREGVKIAMTHIAGAFGKYSPIQQWLDETKPDALVCGHSHILLVRRHAERKMLHLNPGAVGKHGFHTVRTMLQFEIDNGKFQNMNVVEMKR